VHISIFRRIVQVERVYEPDGEIEAGTIALGVEKASLQLF
jgi:hypothetical protein